MRGDQPQSPGCPSPSPRELATAWEHLVAPMTIEERFPGLDGVLLLEAIQNAYRDSSRLHMMQLWVSLSLLIHSLVSVGCFGIGETK
jgi:hypothetical protein